MKYMNQRMKYNLQHFAGKKTSKKGGEGDDDPEDDEDDDPEDDEDEDDPEDDDDKKSKKKKSGKTFTQEEVEAIVEKRLARERREKAKAKKKAEDEETEKKKTPEEKDNDRYEKLTKEMQKMQEKMVCLEHGVSKENIKDVATLARNYVDDETDFEEALEKVLKKYPHFVNDSEEDEGEDSKADKKKKQTYKPKNGGNKKPVNPWKKDTFNLTEQGKLIKEDPEQAKLLAAAAGVTLDLDE